MKRLIFDELLLLSVVHKRARRIKFHPQCTVIRGDNETGKSAIVKSLFAAFGASPPVIEQGWKNAEVTTLLRFSIDGRRYSILRESEAYTLFNGANNVLGTYRHVREGLAAKLADLFDFRLHFYTASGEGRAAHPAYLFAPFYVDQDKGWSNPWASFAVIKAARRLDAVEYHVGIRPNDYFIAKTRLQEIYEDLAAPEQELQTFRRILNDLDQRATRSTVMFNAETFQVEVDGLVRECEKLREREEAYRRRLLRLENESLSLRTQTSLMEKAADELRKDYKFAMRQDAEVECPMCGARYENSIVERFDIAQDEDQCVNFVGRLDQEISRVDDEMTSARADFESTNGELERINALLDTHREKLSLRDVIQAQGQRELRESVVADMTNLEASVDKLRAAASQAKRAMRAATDKERKKQIRQHYALQLQNLAVKLAVSPTPQDMMRSVAPKVTAGGSDLPRRLLAYYVALLHTIHRNTSGLYAPFVVDAVNQQDPTAENVTRMLELLATGLPEGTQLILAGVDTRDVKFEGDSIALTEKRGLLQVDEFDSVAAQVRPLIELRFAAERSTT